MLCAGLARCELIAVCRFCFGLFRCLLSFAFALIAAAKLRGGGSIELVSPRPAPRESRLIGVLYELQRALLLARGDAQSLSTARQALQVMRHGLLAPLKTHITLALRAAQDDMQRSLAAAGAVLRALAPAQHDDGVQVGAAVCDVASGDAAPRVERETQYEEQKGAKPAGKR